MSHSHMAIIVAWWCRLQSPPHFFSLSFGVVLGETDPHHHILAFLLSPEVVIGSDI